MSESKILSRESVVALVNNFRRAHGAVAHELEANDAKQRELIDSLRRERDTAKEECAKAMKSLMEQEDESEKMEAERDTANERLKQLESDASTVAHLRKVLDRVRERPQLGDNLTDSEVAGMVRMMTARDLNHELVCVMARDRIIFLSDKVHSLTSELAEAVHALGVTVEAGKADKARLDFIQNSGLICARDHNVHDIGCVVLFGDALRILRSENDGFSWERVEWREAIDAAMQAAQVETPGDKS